MMLKRSLLIGSLAVVFVVAAFSEGGHVQSLSPERQNASLSEVKQAILAATGYDPAAVELTATHVQFIVTLVNSKLASGPVSPREHEASRITAAIAGLIAEMPEYTGIQAIHIDYVSRKPDGSANRIIDGIDFRKDPQGQFRHHIT